MVPFVFAAKHGLIFLVIWSGMADSDGCEGNPFAKDVVRRLVANLQNLWIITKIIVHTGSVFSDRHS